MKIISVVGARPNFMKASPFLRAIDSYNETKVKGEIQSVLVHTGQHYDPYMSASFFRELQIPEPLYNLGIGSGSHAEQVGLTMIAFEKVVLKEMPDWVVVFGDINATLACSLVARKLNIKICHIEAGLRSGDMTMPEEVNRILTDRVSDLLLTPDVISSQNLQNEGILKGRISSVGNIMIDTLDFFLPRARQLNVGDILSNLSRNGQEPNTKSSFTDISSCRYCIVTLHRPSNVDDIKTLSEIVGVLNRIAREEIFVVWPVHPRTEKNLRRFNLWHTLEDQPYVNLIHPASYLQMLRLLSDASVLLTDSGGLQAESSVLGLPCITIRETTEWQVTLKEKGGTSLLAGTDPEKLYNEFVKAASDIKHAFRPPLWDGQTAPRCLEEILTRGC